MPQKTIELNQPIIWGTSISHHITPLVINNLGVDTHMYVYRHKQTDSVTYKIGRTPAGLKVRPNEESYLNGSECMKRLVPTRSVRMQPRLSILNA